MPFVLIRGLGRVKHDRFAVRDAEAFAQSVLAAGCRRFIVQGFHFWDKRMIPQTREGAFRLMAQILE